MQFIYALVLLTTPEYGPFQTIEVFLGWQECGKAMARYNEYLKGTEGYEGLRCDNTGIIGAVPVPPLRPEIGG